MTPGERALRESAAIVPLDRAVFRLTGEQPLAYLHDVLAQDVAALAASRGALAVALDHQGRVSAEVRVLPLASEVLLDADEASRTGVIDRIGLHAPLAGCELEDESESFVVTAVRGPSSEDLMAAAGVSPPGSDEAAFSSAGAVLVVRVLWGVPGLDLIGPAADVDEVVGMLDVVEATHDELDALRVAAGRPRFGVDVDSSTLVNESPYLAHAVALEKGCYPGQESVARVHNLGSIRRVLRGLRSPGVIRAGADVVRDGSVVGTVRSAAALPEGGSAAIAYLKSEIPPGVTVQVGGSGASVVALR